LWKEIKVFQALTEKFLVQDYLAGQPKENHQTASEYRHRKDDKKWL